MEISHCPVCGSACHDIVWVENNLNVFKCRRCTIAFTDRDSLRTKRSDDYWAWKRCAESEGLSDDSEFKETWRDQRIPLFQETLRNIEFSVPDAHRILDVGSGPGYFPVWLQERQFDTWMIEPNPNACLYARSKLGLRNVYQGVLEEATYLEDEYFDVITMLNVLEHILKPLDTLKAACRLLRMGGIIYIRVPNFSFHLPRCYLHRFLNPRASWYLGVSGHVNQFSRLSIEHCLSLAGFSGFSPLPSGFSVIERKMNPLLYGVLNRAKAIYCKTSDLAFNYSRRKLYIYPVLTVIGQRGFH